MTPIGLHFGKTISEANIQFTDREQRAIDDLISSVQDFYGGRLIAVKLVGSRARGDHREDSDWDFLIFIDQCDFDVEVPPMKDLAALLSRKHGMTEYSLSPLSEDKFYGLDKKYPGITEIFIRDAVNLWP